jgi:hypothetical protein
MQSFDESKSFCTCSLSGNQVDGLPLAPRKDAASASWLCAGRALICKFRRVFSSYGDISKENLLGNLYLSDSQYIEASI